MFGALRRAVDQQDRCRRRDHINHADQRLLRHARSPCPRQREQHCREQGERERIEVGRAARGWVTEHERHRRAERCDLREREIDEDDFARQHLDAEIRVDADQAHRDQERRPEKAQGLDHCDAADVSASTFASNIAM